MGQELILEPEPQLDTFGLFLPLPYRVAVILIAGSLPVFHDPSRASLLSGFSVANRITLGFWGWGLNLHYLSLVKIVCFAIDRNLINREGDRGF